MNTFTSTLARGLCLLVTLVGAAAHAHSPASAVPHTPATTAASATTPVTVDTPWVRATVPQQQASGMFMTLTSDKDRKLVAAQSSAAQSTEIHEMVHEGDVMRMRQVPALALPAGQAVQLRPGSYHIMLIGLNKQIKEDDRVALTLVFENAQGEKETQELMVPARALNAPGTPSPASHGGHKAH